MTQIQLYNMLMELDWNYHSCWHQRWSVKYALRSIRPQLVQLYWEGDLPVDLSPNMPKCEWPPDVYTEGGGRIGLPVDLPPAWPNMNTLCISSFSLL